MARPLPLVPCYHVKQYLPYVGVGRPPIIQDGRAIFVVTDHWPNQLGGTTIRTYAVCLVGDSSGAGDKCSCYCHLAVQGGGPASNYVLAVEARNLLAMCIATARAHGYSAILLLTCSSVTGEYVQSEWSQLQCTCRYKEEGETAGGGGEAKKTREGERVCVCVRERE
jgi:hypothetical protein